MSRLAVACKDSEQGCFAYLNELAWLQEDTWRTGRQRLLRRLNEVVFKTHNFSVESYHVSPLLQPKAKAAADAESMFWSLGWFMQCLQLPGVLPRFTGAAESAFQS